MILSISLIDVGKNKKEGIRKINKFFYLWYKYNDKGLPYLDSEVLHTV